MKIFQGEDVLKLLACEIDRVGGQSEWSRQTGINRGQVNGVLNGRRLPPLPICQALGLVWVIVRQIGPRDDVTESDIISNRAVLLALRKEIEKAGGLATWSGDIGVNRTYLSLVLHRHKSPGKKIIAALNLSEVLVCAKEACVTNLSQKNRATGKRHPHARWQP